MIIKHYFDFGEKTNAQMNGVMDWEYLRQDTTNPAFSIESSRKEYLENCRKATVYEEHAEYIVSKIEHGGVKLCALGAGKGILEWHIKHLRSDIYVCWTDYTPALMGNLKDFFVECDEFRSFDMLGDYSELNGFDIVEMYRISTEFDKSTWKDIFRKIHDVGIKQVFFVPPGFAGIRDIARETYTKLKFFINRKKPTFAGWLYSKREFEEMFEEYFVVSDIKHTDNTAIFTLRRK